MAEGDFALDGTHAVLFAAGLPDMPLHGCSRSLLAAGLSEGDMGLVDLIPSDLWGEVDDWIFAQAQSMEESGASRSALSTSLRLRFPGFEGTEFRADSAWLEIPPTVGSDADEELILLVLKVEGLKQSKALTPTSRLRASLRKRRSKHSISLGVPMLSTVKEEEKEEEENEEQYPEGFFRVEGGTLPTSKPLATQV